MVVTLGQGRSVVSVDSSVVNKSNHYVTVKETGRWKGETVNKCNKKTENIRKLKHRRGISNLIKSKHIRSKNP